MFVPMRPCAALAPPSRRPGGRFGRGRRGGFTGRGDSPQGPRQLRERPLTPTLSPQGEREPDGLAAAGGRSGRGRGGAAPTERTSEGGWVGRAALRGIPRVHDTTVRTLLRDGGVGGAAPSRRGRGTDREMVPPSRRRCAPAAFEGARESPLTPALSPQGEGAGRPRGGRRAIRAGGVGAEPPTERKSEGGWVGPSGPARYPSRLRHDRAHAPPGWGRGGLRPPQTRERARTGRSALGLRPEGRSAHPNTPKAAGSGRSEGRLTAALTHGLRNAGTLRA